MYNNTCFWNPANPTAYALNVQATFDSTQPDVFANNIIVSAVPGMAAYNAASIKGLKADHNIYWYTGTGSPQWQANTGQADAANYGSLPGWQSALSMDAHSLFIDPRLESPTYHAVGRSTTAFTLGKGSPAVKAGWNLGNMGRQDFFGNALPASGPVDIGADQTP